MTGDEEERLLREYRQAVRAEIDARIAELRARVDRLQREVAEKRVQLGRTKPPAPPRKRRIVI